MKQARKAEQRTKTLYERWFGYSAFGLRSRTKSRRDRYALRSTPFGVRRGRGSLEAAVGARPFGAEPRSQVHGRAVEPKPSGGGKIVSPEMNNRSCSPSGRQGRLGISEMNSRNQGPSGRWRRLGGWLETFRGDGLIGSLGTNNRAEAFGLR
jgi:hypothetical protein